MNLLMSVDSYKFSHFNMLPPGTTEQSSYIESRGGISKDTLFFGLQMFLKEYLTRPITKRDIADAKAFCQAHGEPFNEEGFNLIIERYAGYLPIEIQAIPEGTVIETGI